MSGTPLPERTVCLIGYGEVGQTLARDLLARGVGVATFDTLFADSGSAPSRAAELTAVRRGNDLADALAGCGIVVSAVTASDCLAVAREVAPLLAAGTFYLDLNSVSPATKIAADRAISAGRGRYVEAAVMSPILPAGIRSPMLTGGPHAAAFEPLARRLGFERLSFCAPTVGRASATKMCRSVIIKGVESLLTESLVAARRYGVEQAVLDSLGGLLPAKDWPALSAYMIRRSLEHGRRRAAEMREVAVTVRAAGIEPWMSEATSARQDWAAERGEQPYPEEIIPLLDAFLATITEQTGDVPC